MIDQGLEGFKVHTQVVHGILPCNELSIVAFQASQRDINLEGFKFCGSKGTHYNSLSFYSSSKSSCSTLLKKFPFGQWVSERPELSSVGESSIWP